MSLQEFKLPDVGEGLTEAEIIAWKVEPGDVIKINDIIVEIETAKSLVELPSPYAGTVDGLLVSEGETVAVGTPIIAVAPEGHVAEAPAPEADSDDPPVEAGLIGGEAPGGRTAVLVGYGPRTVEAKRRPRKTAAAPSTTEAAATQQDVNGAFSLQEPVAPAVQAATEPLTPEVRETLPTQERSDTRVLAKPPVRKLAKDLGIDLLTVVPSGPGGVVTRADLEAHAGGAASAPVTESGPAQVRAPRGGETRVPIKGVRKMTAQAMVSSAFTAPHVTEWLTVDVTRTVELVDRLKADRAFADVRVSPLLILAKAICLALRRTPEVNATWDEAAQEVVLKHYVNLGIAAATPRGLVVPNVEGADSMTLHELAVALGELVGTAREGRTQPAQMSGGTFTITNVGVFGVDAGTPILNPGEAGILAFGQIRKQPWVVSTSNGDEIVPRAVTTLALSFDHRIVDGEQGSRFLANVGALLEDPATALLY